MWRTYSPTRVRHKVSATSLLCKRPETLDSIDMVSTLGKGLFLIYAAVLAVLLQAFVAFEAVGVVHRPLLSFSPDITHQRFG